MQPLQMDYDLAVIGGGMVGMSLAIGAAQLGLNVAVVDRQQLSSQLDAAYDGRVSAIAAGSARLLESIGVWQAMQPHGEPILDIRVIDGHSRAFLHYDHREVGSAPFGHILENRHIRSALHEAAREQRGLTLLEATSVAAMDGEQGCRTLTLAGSHAGKLRCKLLVAADGKRSQIRQMAGIGVTSWPYRQIAIVCTIEHEAPHHGLALECFYPAGPFAVLPMQRNRSSLVWVEPVERAAIYLALCDAELISEISERLGDYLGAVTHVLHRFSYPLSLMHARRMTDERLALAGDAAHGMHPIAGQGVNLGFRDVAVLMDLLESQHALGLDIGAASLLSHYARWRAFDNVAMLAATDGINRLFSNDIAPIRWARSLGLLGVSKLPQMKRFFMLHAMGLTGDLPRRMQRAA